MHHIKSKMCVPPLHTINLLKMNSYCTKANNYFDILIAGGGMVGTTLACVLGMNNKLCDKKILLLESSKEFKFNISDKYSNRVVALAPHSQTLLSKINAWQYIAKARYGIVSKMQVWDSCSDSMITFSNKNLSEAICYIVENDLLLSAVNNVAKTIANLTIVNESKIKDYVLPKQGDDTVYVILENGDKYTCSLLVGADGANSKVRNCMGIQYLNWKYNQMGIVATLTLSESTNNIVAWQRFLPTGPIALLPLNDNQSSLVWTTTLDHAKELLRMPEDQFVDSVNNALWKIYPPENIISVVTKGVNNFLENFNFASNAVRQLPPSVSTIEPNSRAAFPLGFGHASNYVSKCVALVGDAAHRVHPLAGQGVNLGFGDIACLTETLADAIYNGQNLGTLYYLKEYERVRQLHNLPIMLAIDALQKLYSTQLTPFVLLRSLALQIMHTMTPVKKMIIERAAT